MTEQLLAVANSYAQSQGIPLSAVSSRVFDDGKRLPAIAEHGATITLKRAEMAFDWFSQNWPSDLNWPSSVQRPPPKGEGE